MSNLARSSAASKPHGQQANASSAERIPFRSDTNDADELLLGPSAENPTTQACARDSEEERPAK